MAVKKSELYSSLWASCRSLPEWKAKLKKQTFSDANIARAIRELQTLL